MLWLDAPTAFGSHPLVTGADAEDALHPALLALRGAWGVAGGPLEPLLQATAVPDSIGSRLGASRAGGKELPQALVHFDLLFVHSEQLTRHISLLALDFNEYLVEQANQNLIIFCNKRIPYILNKVYSVSPGKCSVMDPVACNLCQYATENHAYSMSQPTKESD
jgi:hypothetical protein